MVCILMESVFGIKTTHEFDEFKVNFQTVLKPQNTKIIKEILIISGMFMNNREKNSKIFISIPFFVLTIEKRKTL